MSQPVAQDRIARYVALIEREQETMTELAERVASQWTLEQVCAAWDVPFARMAAWIAADARRREMYEGAQAIAADGYANDTVLIADSGGGDTQHTKVRIAARQWIAARWDRGRYGDALQVQHTGETVVRFTFGGSARPALIGSGVAEEADGGGEI